MIDHVRSAERPGRIDAWLFGLFFASGLSALTYQTAWQRMLGLFSGSDTVSATIVVAAFLLGLGIGSLAGSWIADRLSDRRAIVAFALCEVGIAGFAALSKLAFYDVVFERLTGLAASRPLVFAIAFVGLLVPTFLMGLSLPLLAKAIVRSIATASQRIGWLYGMNTLGAAAGAFTAGCFLIGTIGFESAVYVAAIVNLVVAAGAIVIAPRFAIETPFRAAPKVANRANRELWRWCVLVFVSGALIISLEIVWFRIFGTMMQSTAYAFAVVLGWFLVGDALGMMLGAALVRRMADPERVFLRLQGLVALYAVGALWLVAEAHEATTIGQRFIAFDFFRTPAITAGHISVVMAIAAAAVVPPAALLGMSFPITQKAIQLDPALVGQRVGQIQVANIFGNVVGSAVTGLLLLQWLGSADTLRLLVGIALVLTLLGALPWRPPRLAAVPRLTLGLAAALVVMMIGFPASDRFWSMLHGATAREGVIVAEDHTGVAVLRHGTPDTALLFIGGHAQSNVPFSPVHGLLGLVGVLSHERPETVLVVGSGAGGTPYGAGSNPATRRIHVVEIVAPVYDVMKRYVSVGGRTAVDRLWRDSRYEWTVGDARRVLYTSTATYDVIEADAILPRSSHSGLLYSTEYFQQLRGRLRPGGIAVQWAPTPRTIASFLAVFDHVVELQVGFDTILLGSDRAMGFDQARLIGRMRQEDVADYLRRGGWDNESLVRSIQGARVRVWSPADPRRSEDVNTDLFPKDEFYLNRRKASLF